MPKFTTMLLLSFCCLLPLSPLTGQVVVELTPPELQDGMAQLEAMVATELIGAAREVEDLIAPLVEKPELLTAFGDAAGATAPLLPVPPPARGSRFLFGISTELAIASDMMYYPAIQREIEAFDETKDIYLGAALQPLMLFARFPLDLLVSGASALTGLGVFHADPGEFELQSFRLRGGISLPVLTRRPLGRHIDFSGIHGSAQFSLYSLRIAALVRPGVMTEGFSFDPDNDGPFPSQDVTIQLDPTLELAGLTTVSALSLSASTGISLLDMVGIAIEAGLSWTGGSSRITIDTDEEIAILGYLSGLIAEGGNSRLTISGGSPEVSPKSVQLFLKGNIAWQVGSLLLSLPLSIGSSGTFAAGVCLGVSF